MYLQVLLRRGRRGAGDEWLCPATGCKRYGLATALPLGQGLEVHRPPPVDDAAAGDERPEPPQPTGAITLRQALALALNTILSCMLTPGNARSRGACPTGGLRPNPELRRSSGILPAARISPVPGRSRPRSVWRRPSLGGDIERRRELAVCRRSWRVRTTKRRAGRTQYGD